MQGLVDGCTEEAWAGAARNLLRPAGTPPQRSSGADWQDAIRREWQSQQPLRAGSVQQEITMKAWKHAASFWMFGPGNDTCYSYVISCMEDDVIWLFNASAVQSSPVQLALRAIRFEAYIRKDGRLCIAQALGPFSPTPLVWHIIDPGTGQTMSSVEKHIWPLSLSLMGLMHHSPSHQVLAMVDHETVTIMDGDTLEESARCNISPCQRSPSMPDLIPFAMRWSPDGALLAVSLRYLKRPPGGGLPPRSEVQIFDTRSGQRMQSLVMPADSPSMRWSDSKNLLAAYGHRNGQPGPGNGPGAVGLWVMQPAQNVITEVPPSLADTARWRNWSWTPNEPLLLGSGDGFCIFDPCTKRAIFECDYATYRGLSWAEGLSCSTRGKAMAVCLRQGQRGVVRLARDSNGEWQAPLGEWESEVRCHDAIMSPCGRHIVTKKEDAGGHAACICQYDYCTSEEHVVARRFHIDEASPWVILDWAPIPAAWPQLYAYIHEEIPEPSGDQSVAVAAQSVKLVNSSQHKIVGSWKVTDGSHAADQQKFLGYTKKATQLKWSANGKHLAVFCTDWVQVLTFDQTQ